MTLASKVRGHLDASDPKDSLKGWVKRAFLLSAQTLLDPTDYFCFGVFMEYNIPT